MRDTFHGWVEQTVERAGGWRAAARQSGINHATLLKAAGKVGDNDNVGLGTLEALAEWTKAPLIYIFNLYQDKNIESDQQLAWEIEQLRNTHPELIDALKLAFELGPDELKDVLEYIQFKARKTG